VSLIDYHVNTIGETEGDTSKRNGIIPSYLDDFSSSRPRKKAPKAKTAITSLNITTVRAAEERGETWDDEIDQRMAEFLGVPSSPARSDQMPMSPTSPALPSTQPLGESGLGSTFARDRTWASPSVPPDDPDPVTPPSPVAHLSDDDLPIIPASQKSPIASRSPSPVNSSPFRGRRGLRADGDSSDEFDSAERHGGKRIRVENGTRSRYW
jgi:hypothetical protein